MTSRQAGYYGPSPTDIDRGFWGCFAAFLLPIALLLLIAGACTLDGCTAEPEPEPATVEATAAEIVMLDTSDAELMHHLGMPTRADVIAYHLYGRWAWAETVDDVYTVHSYQGLPGDAGRWGLLYGLDPNDPDYKY